jgi:Family of unknown function (DUF6228)
MSEIQFQSPSDGSTLRFAITDRYNGENELEFEVSVVTPWFSGRAPASTYVSGSPSAMFRAMALEWQGWKDLKTWADIENRVSFGSKIDPLGHVSITVELNGQDYDSKLRVVLECEAGQLDEMAQSMSDLLG